MKYNKTFNAKLGYKIESGMLVPTKETVRTILRDNIKGNKRIFYVKIQGCKQLIYIKNDTFRIFHPDASAAEDKLKIEFCSMYSDEIREAIDNRLKELAVKKKPTYRNKMEELFDNI